jgi:Cu/Ag efflux pump CusA
VVIGGIISSTALTLLVLPALYRLVQRRKREERDTGIALSAEQAAH